MGNSRVYIGIDVGANGGLFAFNSEDEVLLKEAVPKLKGSTDVDYKKMYRLLEETYGCWPMLGFKVRVGIEDVHSLYGMSAKSNFSFGFIKGLKVGFLEALGLEYELVAPKKWQSVIWTPEDIVPKPTGRGKDTKATSLNAATRIFPDVDFTKSDRATKPHDGIFDAALIAEYIKRTWKT